MSVGAVLAVAAALIGALVWAVGTADLARANPDQRIPHRRNDGWRRYQVFYAVGLFAVIFGIITLTREIGLWTLLPAFIAVLTPQLVITATHRRRVGLRTAER